jgi:hypothetical protein
VESIDDFVRRNWQALVKGAKPEVSAHALEHPRSRPDLFLQTGEAWPVGQTCDYVWPLEDGSRVHVQCIDSPQGPRTRVHRDRWDPNRDIGSFVAHGLFETPLVPIVALICLGALALSES